MSSFDKINSIGQPKYIWSLKQLHLKEKYNIIKAERCDTDFGEKIMLELEDCKVYLPQRFTTELTCEDIENLPKCSMELLEPSNMSFAIDFHEKREAKLTPVKKFQSVGQKQKQQKTIKKLKELQLKKKYDILNAKRNSSGIVVELDDCKVNLPKRFSTDLLSQDIEDLTTCAMELLEPLGNSFSIDFHEKKEVKISFVDKFKALGLFTYQNPHHKSFKSLKELESKKWYKILNAKKYTSQYGEQIMVELGDCKVNLPKRFTSKLDGEDLTNLTKCSMQLLEPDGWSFSINFREEATQ